jgi:predicted AlkP superfamily phosphohydrolase/phosphomutase
LIDWSRTTAYALTAAGNGIYLRQSAATNTTGAADSDYAAMRQRLIAQLLDFKNPETDEPVIQEVLTREEAFPGQFQSRAPDLTLVMRDRSFISVLRADGPLQARRMPYGTHHPDGIFIAGGPGVRAGEQLPPSSIVQITPTLLYSLGTPLPLELDGEPLLAAFEPSFVAANPVQVEAARAAVSEPLAVPSVFDADGERELIDRLTALGYLE